MEELLPFLQKFEIWVYIVLGIAAFFPLQRLISAWRAWQASVYGLEREIAQRRFSAALTMLVLLVLFIFVEFVIVSFVAPNYPQMAAFPTPTLDLLATPTVTLAAPQPGAAGTTTADPNGGALVNGVTATGQPGSENCTPGKIEWTAPKAGEEISANMMLKGTVNVPNLGFYKYEFSKQGEDVWTTIAGGDQPKVEGEIGFWNIDQRPNGDYRLRLVVADNENKLFPACVIPVRIVKP